MDWVIFLVVMAMVIGGGIALLVASNRSYKKHMADMKLQATDNSKLTATQKDSPTISTAQSRHYSKAESNMFVMACLAMVFSVIAYVVAALIISANLGWQYILAFVFGALVYIPVVCLPYYCIKVFADMSRNTRLTTEDLQEIRKALNCDSKSVAAEEAAQQEQANA